MAAAPRPSRGKSAVLQLDDLTLDPQLQMRADGTDAAHAGDLAAALKHRDKLPPVRVWEIAVEGEEQATAFFVTDGFHTVEGHRIAGRKSVQCKVFKGTWHDALLDAAAANQKHLAKKRSVEDKKRAVLMVLEAAPDWTGRRVAQHVGVSHSFVDDIRAEMEELAARPNPEPTKRVSASGKTYPTARKKPKKVEPSVEGDWRALPLAEFLRCGDDELLPTLERHKCVTAGDLAEAIRTDRLPDGKRLGLWDGLVQDILRELEKLPGYDGPVLASEPAKPAAGAETVYQWREWDQHFGPLVRSLDALAATHPAEKKSDEFKKAKHLLSDLADVAKAWRERLASAGE